MANSTLVVFASFLCLVSCQIYVDDSYPYGPGPFQVEVKTFSGVGPGEDGPIYTSTTFYPVGNHTFGVYYFISGFFGVIPSSVYDGFFQRIAAHGYVVFVTWNAFEGTGIDKHIEHIKWLEDNVPGELGDAMPSFDHVTLSCHSAGCSPQIKLMANYTDMWRASVNIDPSTFAIGNYDLDFGIPVLNLGTEYGARTDNGSCVYPNLNYLRWHSKSVCPRIMMEAEDAGHCETLDDSVWAECVEFCGGDLTWEGAEEFKDVLKGNAVAFTNAYVLGNMDQLQYVSDPDLIPWNMLTFEADVEC